MATLHSFFEILYITIISLNACALGSKDNDYGIRFSDLTRGLISPLVGTPLRLNIDLSVRTGQSCKCSWEAYSQWSTWTSCFPRKSCFESSQRRTRKCRHECYRIQIRRCQKPTGCDGSWGQWYKNYTCPSSDTTVANARFCYSADGKLGSYCSNSSDAFYQEKLVPCTNYASPRGAHTGIGSTSNWDNSSGGSLVLIILAVLAGIFCVALIFVSVMFASLRRSILPNIGSKSRSVTESTVSAASCLTTVTEKEISYIGGNSNYNQIKATTFRPPSSAKGLPSEKINDRNIAMTTYEEVKDAIKYPLNMEQKRDGEKTEAGNREYHFPNKSNVDDGPEMARKSQNMHSETTSSNEASTTAISTNGDHKRNIQKSKSEYFQSLPLTRKEAVTQEKQVSKKFRFSGGKSERELFKKVKDNEPRDRTKSEGKIGFSRLEKPHPPKPHEPTSEGMQHGINSNNVTQNNTITPTSNTFLFSPQAFSSLQRTSASKKTQSKNGGFKLDYNSLIKKAVAANARGRGGIDGKDDADNARNDSGNYSHIDLDFKAYGSALDAKPIEADAVSNGSAYADVWDADYASKPASENDEDDYSEVFDAKSNTKNTATARAFARSNKESFNRSLPNRRMRNTIHEARSRLSYHPTSFGTSQYPSKDIVLPSDECDNRGTTLDGNSNECLNEPIYCAI